MPNALDLTGQRYGRLTVVRRFLPVSDKHTRWVCICDCGKETVAKTTNLQRSEKLSCGCLRSENARALTAKYRPEGGLPEGEASFNAVFSQYAAAAKARGYCFELTKEQAADLMQRPCAYCGQEPSNVHASKKRTMPFVYSGIDRVDNTKGYSSDNCVSCCFTCNKMKGTLSADEFLEHIDRVHSYR